ncbi:transcription antitermination factor NusB [Periweissella cryptocerci]|uniref:Transcription antitermination protein NusB n=1 Tax=Periweissella cryptocerci TaxID=2506420 RepID=A0A4P6YVN4_9LACO|nr:transcription antitermination factor NusB [Periweissella cryptocerci]QBO36787.1 transcription antitermination factor NusB [Periweissella cryptocerci]
MTMTRHQTREKAFQTLFALAGNPEADMASLYDDVMEDVAPDNAEDEKASLPDYLITLVNGVLEYKAELEVMISQHLADGWTFARLAKADRVILEIAFFELNYGDAANTPAKVVVDEALNLAKTFSDESSRKFINAVLDKALHENIAE